MITGELDREIEIQSFSTTKDALNDDVRTWSTDVTLWANVQEEKGTEGDSASKQTAKRKAVFKIRYREGLTEKERIRYNSQNYDIISIQEIGRREGMEITAEARI